MRFSRNTTSPKGETVSAPYRPGLHASVVPGRRGRGRRAAVMALTLAGFAVPTVGATTAQASPVQTVRIPMQAVGYDMAIANAHGYRIENVNGVLRSVKVSNKPITQTAPAGMSPNLSPVVSGNCGTSFLYYAAQGGRKAQVYTGFDLAGVPAVSYSWKVAVTDKAGVGSKTWSGGLLFRYDWDEHWTTSHSVSGYSYAVVVYGFADLADGLVCHSGLPGQSTNLY